jgi:putative glutamine amidotransferase
VGHVVFEQYLQALAETALLPLTIPACGAQFAHAGWEDQILERIDGLILPGSASNVAPHHYGGAHDVELALDEQRDATALPLIRAAFQAGAPILAICRGFQELNVALGGSLHIDLGRLPGSLSHSARTDVPRAERYEPTHALEFVGSGHLRQRLLEDGRDLSAIQVNSLHRQGIARLAPALQPEARTSDGLIEAASCRVAGRFVLGVQWHPEWGRSGQGLDDMILRDFEAACLAYREKRLPPAPLSVERRRAEAS